MAPPPLIPLEQFFANPERGLARLSPDGARISWLAPDEGVMNVWVADRGGGEPRCVTSDRARGIRSFFWSRDARRILFPRDVGGDENYHLFAVSPDDDHRRERDLTPFAGVRAGVVALPRADPRHAVVSMNLRDRSLFDAYRLNLANGRLRPVAENPGRVAGWLADRDGRVRLARAQTASGDVELWVRDDERSPFRLLASFDNEDGGWAYGFRADGAAIYVGSARDCDRLRLVEISLSDGAERVLYEHPEVDIGGPVLSDRSGRLLGVHAQNDRSEMHVVDPSFGSDWEHLHAVHPGDPHITGQDADETTWVVHFDHDRDPGAVFVVDRRSGDAQLLHRTRPWLSDHPLAECRPQVISSRDGLQLRCYLTLPVGVAHRDLPMVLVVHGGPWARDAWGYNAEAQFLANRGYAVLQVNYRGSTGFGKSFSHAAEREFAGAMHDDLVDAVRWAIDEGIADPDRVGIYGGSYGGYATLVGVTFTPDLFAAAISYVGPSSLVTLVRSFPDYWRPLLRGSWYRFVGDPEDPDDLADMERRSPLNYVDRITTPLMVVQGANDPRVTRQESDQLVAALRSRGVAVEYILKQDEGHGFVVPENRLDLYRAMERFFAEHLGGRRGPDSP